MIFAVSELRCFQVFEPRAQTNIKHSTITLTAQYSLDPPDVEYTDVRITFTTSDSALIARYALGYQTEIDIG
jgi:hypothetical protein